MLQQKLPKVTHTNPKKGRRFNINAGVARPELRLLKLNLKFKS